MASSGTDDKKTSSDYYWNSYAHFSIHEEMLKDEVRTLSYKRAITDNAHLYRDKIVLDVGCGTGILSLFAAQAGAKHVYAVDMSDIIQQATQIVKDNGFEGKITCIQGKIEEVQLPVEKVDIIISEWMGYFLVYESMLHSVLVARDRFLKPGGIMMPDEASLSIAGIEDAEYKQKKIHFWDNVYGFDFSCIKSIAMKEPLVDTVESDAINTSSCKFLTLDLYKITPADLSLRCPFRVRATRNDYVHAFIVWFDIRFTKCHKPIYFSTAPFARYTHWKQTVFYMDDVLSVSENEEISGVIEAKQNERNHRDWDIVIQTDFDGQYEQIHKKAQYILR